MELLKEWTNYEQQSKKANWAARKVARTLEYLHGSAADICADCMPYTSSSEFAAIWNANAEARKPNTNLYFRNTMEEDNIFILINNTFVL